MNKREEAKRSQMEKEMYRNRYSVGDLRQSYSEKNRYENPTQKVPKLSFSILMRWIWHSEIGKLRF